MCDCDIFSLYIRLGCPRHPSYAIYSRESRILVFTSGSNNGDLCRPIYHIHLADLMMLFHRIALIDAILVYPEKSHAKFSCHRDAVADDLRQGSRKRYIPGLQLQLPDDLNADPGSVFVILTPHVAQGSITAAGASRDYAESVAIDQS